MKYGIAIIVDNNPNQNQLRQRLRSLADFIQPITREGFDAATGQSFTYTVLTLKGITPDIEAALYAGVNSKYQRNIANPSLTPRSIPDDSGFFSRVLWFGPESADYTIAEIRARLNQMMREDGCEKVWIVDDSTVITGDLLSKFV